MVVRTETSWREALAAWTNVEQRHPLAWRGGALALVAGAATAVLIELERLPRPPRALQWSLMAALVLLALGVGRRVLWNDAERRLRAAWRLAGFVALVIGLSIAAVAARLPLSGSRLATGSSADVLRVTLTVLVIITLAALVTVRALDRRPLRQLGIVPGPGYGGDLAFGLALGAGLMTLVFVAELCAGWITVVGVLHSRVPHESFAAGALYMGLAFVAVAFYEELSDRGYLLRTLAQGFVGHRIPAPMALVAAALLSSLAFGLGHLGNPHATLVSTFNITVTGVMLALPYVLTGSLAASIGLHASWNFFQGVVYGFPVSGLTTPAKLLVIEQAGPPLWTGAEFGPEAGLVDLFVSLLGAALIVWRERRKRGSPIFCAELVDGASSTTHPESAATPAATGSAPDQVTSREEVGFDQVQ